MLFSDSDVAAVRHVVQRILVPCVFVVGLLGNSVSIYVLTRKRMRCTTNIYLSALAMTDIIYLTMALLLSLKHNAYVQRHCEAYWQHYGTVLWLCDACAYISIYIAVCFTIERFIAIRYPLKRQTFCTESLAKKVIAGVALFCLVSTLSTAFEHEYRTDYRLIDSNGRPCNASDSIETSTDSSSASASSASFTLSTVDLNLSSIRNRSDSNFRGGEDALAVEGSMREKSRKEVELSAANIPTNVGNSEFLDVAVEFVAPSSTSATTAALPALLSAEKFGTKRNDSVSATVDYCQNVTFYANTSSSLGRNELYRRIWYFFTLFVFVLIPLFVLSTFNFFLIMLVRRSRNLRGEMTNENSIRRPKRKLTISSVSQENRVTVTLIAVVLLFIVCQLPWAIYLIVSERTRIEPNTEAIIGNVFNFLTAINAAANFFLYCVLSDKYRCMVRQLVTGYRYRSESRRNNNHNNHHNNNNTMNTSLYASTTTTSRSSSRRYRPAIMKYEGGRDGS